MDPSRERALRARQHKKKAPAPFQASTTLSNSGSVNALKSKIRDVKRVLEHAHDLPLDVRIEKERALAGYRHDLEKAEIEKERQRMIKKYHMVRFFERQKATRNLKRLRTQLASAAPSSPEHETLDDRVHCAEVDLNYTLYHPLAEKYIGIFPRQEHPKVQDETGLAQASVHPRQDKPAMWTIVEACMGNGTLQELRDGKLTIATSVPLRPQRATTKINHREPSDKDQKSRVAGYAGGLAANGDDDASDGGFFEE